MPEGRFTLACSVLGWEIVRVLRVQRLVDWLNPKLGGTNPPPGWLDDHIKELRDRLEGEA